MTRSDGNELCAEFVVAEADKKCARLGQTLTRVRIVEKKRLPLCPQTGAYSFCHFLSVLQCAQIIPANVKREAYSSANANLRVLLRGG
jgi:hypothetical protein